MKRVVLILSLILAASLSTAAPSKKIEEKKEAAPAAPATSESTTATEVIEQARAAIHRPSAEAIASYNKGTSLLMEKKFAEARTELEATVNGDPKFAEAHNNLAHILRKQGELNYAKALEHYNTALELKPLMAEAYMYRGVLYVQMGKMDLAKADLEKLRSMKVRGMRLAAELDAVITTGREKEPEQFFGVVSKLDENGRRIRREGEGRAMRGGMRGENGGGRRATETNPVDPPAATPEVKAETKQ